MTRVLSTEIRLLAAAGILSAFVTAAPSAAADGEQVPDHKRIRDRFGASASLGYAHGIQIRQRTYLKDTPEVSMLLFSPQLRFELLEHGVPGDYTAGRLDFVLETQLAWNFQPSNGFGGGITGGFRYRIARANTWSPYVFGLAGVGGIDFGLRDQDDGFAFWLQAGVGVRRRLTDQTGLTLDVRFHHISNLAFHPPNDGIDSIAVSLGFDFR